MNNMKVQSENQVYERLKLLGEGAFGKAYLVREKSTELLCVIKQMNIAEMSATEQQETFKEAKILEALNHPNIVKFRDVYVTTNKKLSIVMEYADGGDISKRIAEQKKLQKPFPQSTILDWFTQLCLAIKHVHDRKIIHRDIKGQNVFITKNNMLKLGDFGIARILNRTMEKARTVVGTPYYLSPEIIENKPYSFKSDIWSMGVMLYEMCALQPPFNANSLQFLALKIVKGSYQPLQGNFSKEIKSLIGSMLNIDPNRRPSAKQILQLPFILSRINNFLTETQNKVEFSHTVLHNFKLNFKVPTAQQINQAQIPVPQQQEQKLQPSSSYEAERNRLKEQQAKMEKEREEARAEAKREQERRQRILNEQRRAEEKKRAEDYQRLIEAKKRQVEAAERVVQQRQRQAFERQLQEQKRQREAKNQMSIQQRLEEEKKKQQYLEFNKAEWFRNQQIRRNAERRAQMENEYQSEPPPESRPSQPPQVQKQVLNEAPRQQQPAPQKSNYHFKDEQPTKPLIEAYKQLQQPTKQRPSSQNRVRQSEPAIDDEQLMNAFVNPNFKKRAEQQQQQQRAPEVKKPERPSSVQPKKEVKQQPPKDEKQIDLKKKIEEGRMKMRLDRQKHLGNSTGDICEGLTTDSPNPTIPDETFKAAKWEKPKIPLPTPPSVIKSSSALPEQNLLQKSEKVEKWQIPVVKADPEDLNRIIKENELLEKMIQQQVLIEEKQSSQMQNMINELKKIVNDVQEKVELLPQVKVKLDVRKDDQVEPEKAADFHENTIYEDSDANLEYFSDYNKLESLRMSLEDVFGTQNFVRAYRIIERDFETVGMAGMDMDLIQQKINFISEEQFAQHFTMLLTLVVMQNKVDEEARSPNR